jgi:uncharacterized membrane protein
MNRDNKVFRARLGFGMSILAFVPANLVILLGLYWLGNSLFQRAPNGEWLVVARIVLISIAVISMILVYKYIINPAEKKLTQAKAPRVKDR